MSSKVSAVILSKNEKTNMARCLKSLSWCDETIVIDDYSTDDSVKIAKSFGAKIYKKHLKDDFSSQRNFGLKKAKYNWVLFLDPDEVITKKLSQEIKNNISKPTHNGYLLKRVDHWLGKKLLGGENGSIYLLRLTRKNDGRWERLVHETLRVGGGVKKLENHIIHYPHPTVTSYLSQINYYSGLHAKQNEIELKKVNVTKIITYPVIKFIVNFFYRSGHKDGTHGFVAAILMSFHSYLAWSQLWLKTKSEKPKTY